MNTLIILIPTDFSLVSLQGLQMAKMLAMKMPVQLHLLHVVEANDQDISEGINLEELIVKESQALMNFNSLKESGENFQFQIKRGLLIDEINLAAAELSADLIIMGTNGADGFMEKISGSEAQHVARYLTIPVLTLRPHTPITELKNILLVADFEHFGNGIQMSMLKMIAEAFGSTIHLLQILKENDEKYADQIEAQMNFFAREHVLNKFEIHLYRDHHVVEGVRNFNKEAEMDLVCVRTHGRKGINHILFGSIAERLVNRCMKPLLTFKLKI